MRRRLIGVTERAVLGLFMALGALFLERLLRARMRPPGSPAPRTEQQRES